MSSVGTAPRAAVPMSNARAEASRRNGAKSRGPKTPEGKARSAQNALRHGMRAQKYVVLPEEDADEFAGLEAALIDELAPVGALQTVLARRIAVAAWRLARADRIEIELFAEGRYAGGGLGLALIRDGNGTRSFETLLRYRGAAMAEFWRALRTLKALQAEQAAALEMPAGEDAAAERTALKSPARIALRPRPPDPASGPNPNGPRPQAQPGEPERGAGARLEYISTELPAPGCALHEPAAPWLPKEPEVGLTRHVASTPGSCMDPRATPELVPTRRGRKPPAPSASRKSSEPQAEGKLGAIRAHGR